jgi:Zn-dependent protease
VFPPDGSVIEVFNGDVCDQELRKAGYRLTVPLIGSEVPAGLVRIEVAVETSGVGAFVRLRQRPVDAIEDARIGLAGPFWGLGAALVALGAWRVTGSGLALAIAQLGAWINLFKLLPLGPLDGGRAFRALARPGRWLAAGALLAAWWVTREGLLLLLLVVAALRAFATAPAQTDRPAMVEYAVLVAALSALVVIRES